MRVALVAAVAAAILVVPSSAGGYQHTSWIVQQDINKTDDAFEPHNPSPGQAWCLWSVDDHGNETMGGELEPGDSFVNTKCQVADWCAGGSCGPYGFATGWMWAKTAGVTLEICYEPQGRCFMATPQYVAEERAYKSSLCTRVHYQQGDPALVEIHDSGGGTGVVTTITTTITNTGDRRVRNIYVFTGYASDVGVSLGWDGANEACLPNYPYVDHFDYPFSWN